MSMISMDIVCFSQRGHGTKTMASLTSNGDRNTFVISPSLLDSFCFWFQLLKSTGKDTIFNSTQFQGLTNKQQYFFFAFFVVQNVTFGIKKVGLIISRTIFRRPARFHILFNGFWFSNNDNIGIYHLVLSNDVALSIVSDK